MTDEDSLLGVDLTLYAYVDLRAPVGFDVIIRLPSAKAIARRARMARKRRRGFA